MNNNLQVFRLFIKEFFYFWWLLVLVWQIGLKRVLSRDQRLYPEIWVYWNQSIYSRENRDHLTRRPTIKWKPASKCYYLFDFFQRFLDFAYSQSFEAGALLNWLHFGAAFIRAQSKFIEHFSQDLWYRIRIYFEYQKSFLHN